MHYIGIIGLIATGLGILLLVAQVLSADFMNIRNRQKFQEVIHKDALERTDDEQKFIDTTWHKYYATKVRNISFMIGLPLLGLTLFFDYITQ